MCPQGPSAHPGPRAFWLGGVWSVGQLSEDGRGLGSVGHVVAVALRVLRVLVHWVWGKRTGVRGSESRSRVTV